MSVTCPVCKSTCAKATTKCKKCGFDDLQRTFINTDDGDYWIETVVIPYRQRWEIQKREAELMAQLEQSRQSEATLAAQAEEALQKALEQ